MEGLRGERRFLRSDDQHIDGKRAYDGERLTMTNIDGKEASRIARDYLVDIHGNFFVWDFQVESATPEEEKWKVRCSYTSSLSAGAPRYTYEIEVNKDGTVSRVQRINPADSQ